MEPAPHERHDRIAFADAFRAVAILAVVANHIALESRLNIFGQPDDLAYLGAWGVDCFFVLSGYLLSRQYLGAILEERSFPSTRAFLARRFFRIYPLYAFAVIVSAIAPALLNRERFPIAAVATHLAFVNGFLPKQMFSLNEPLWTMAVDAQFYLLLPVVAFVLALVAQRIPARRRVGIVVASIVATVVFCVAYRWYVFVAFDLHVIGDDVATTFVLARNVVGMAAAFALGTLVALVARIDRARRPLAPQIAFAGGVACFAILAWGGRNIVDSLPYGVAYDLFGATSAALLLYGLSSGAFDVADKLRRFVIVERVAALAYGVYLFHFLILRWSVAALESLTSIQEGSVLFAFVVGSATLAGSFAVAMLTARMVERPFLALRDRFRQREEALARSVS